jgi:hypothetical protein
LRDVEVGADRKRDGDREIAISGRLAVHVEHVLDKRRQVSPCGAGLRDRTRTGG